jgi:4-alpha-glucanotransferase
VPTALERLAGAYGVEAEYEGVDGRTHRADDDAVRAVLRALGAGPVGTGDDVEALRAERSRRHTRLLEPVTALRQDAPAVLQLRLPAGIEPADCRVELTAEDGSPMRWRARPLGTRSATFEGSVAHVHDIELIDPSGSRLLPGYYHLTVETPDQASADGLVVVAPRCPLPPTGWGVFAPLHGVRTGADWGVGSYTDLAELGRWAGCSGAGFVGTLPLYPAFLDQPYDPSPYLPVTRLGWNEVFIDPVAVPESDQAARALLASSSFQRSVAANRDAADVDYRSVMAVLRQVLEPMARHLVSTPSLRRDALFDFALARPELVAYARFRSAMERDGHPPTNREAIAAAELVSLDPSTHYHLYVQWVAESQLETASGHLYLDLPAGAHPDGFDPWWEPGAFVEGVQGGAPPDGFFATGQTWGFRPLHPRAIRHDHYRYPIAYLRQAMRHASVLRIDHVMGWHRLYWVPTGFAAESGVYVRYHLAEMAAVVALEAHRSGTAVVGEDLGTVPDVVRQAMTDHQVLRSWVFEFEASAEVPLPDPPELAMASIGTHDLPRFASFWDGDDLDDLVGRGAQSQDWAEPEGKARRAWRQQLLGAIGEADSPEAAGRALRACLDHLADGPARLMVVDLEDLWLERRPVNRPGSGPEAPNWRARMAPTLAAIVADPIVAELLSGIELRRTARARPGAKLDVARRAQDRPTVPMPTGDREEVGR